MHPFLKSNQYFGVPFSYSTNFENFRQPNVASNSGIYSFINPNFYLHNKTFCCNSMVQPQILFFLDSNMLLPNLSPVQHKKKRITKRLALNERKNAQNSTFNHKAQNFKYFDPARAPPLTSLRNGSEVMKDLQISEKTPNESLQPFSPFQAKEKAIRTLQLLLTQPSPQQYPFLICKKRKSHRMLKRRYSAAYFQQRAAYILRKQRLPSFLRPKNKVRQPRVRNNTNASILESSSQSDLQSFAQDFGPGLNQMNRSSQENQNIIKVEDQYFEAREQQIKNQPIQKL